MIPRALRRAHGIVARYAPTEVTVYQLSYASDDDPFDATAQFTTTTHRVRGTFAPQSTQHEPVGDQGTIGGVVTLNQTTLGFVPTESDRIEVGGVVFNIVEVHDIQGAIVRCIVRGPAPGVS